MNLKSIGSKVSDAAKKTGSVVVNTDLADMGKGVVHAASATKNGVSNKVHSGRKAATDLRARRVAASQATQSVTVEP